MSNYQRNGINSKTKFLLRKTATFALLLATLQLSFASSDQTSNSNTEKDSILSKYFTPTATGTLSTNYIWRGISQTDNNPSAQATFNLSSIWGTYLEIFGSNVDFPDINGKTATTEMDLYGGIKKTFGKLTLDSWYSRYTYPRVIGLSYNEVGASTTYQICDLISIAGYGFYSSNVFDVHENGTYISAETSIGIPSHFLLNVSDVRLLGSMGHYYFSGGNVFDGHNYTDYSLGVSKSYKAFTASLVWVGTNRRFEDGPLDQPRWLGSISASI